MGIVRKCQPEDFETLYEIVNDSAEAYRGVIPADRWHEPYMPRDELAAEIDAGVEFWGYVDDDGALAGIMGIQDRGDVALIRHAYVRPSRQRSGIGRQLMKHLEQLTDLPVLVGTWADAWWAVRFYERNGFEMVKPVGVKDRLLRTYWDIPDRQVATSVVLADRKWTGRRRAGMRDALAEQGDHA